MSHTPPSSSRIRLRTARWVGVGIASVLCGAIARASAPGDDAERWRQRALTPAEVQRLDEFLGAHDAILVSGDSAELLEHYDLGARESALAWMEQVEGRIDGARSKTALGWRIRDRVCALVRTAYDIAPERGGKGVRQERIDHRIVLLRDEGQSFRIVQLSSVRVTAPAGETGDPREISCTACNFHVDAPADWFVIHHRAVGSSLTEKVSLHHVSGQATLEIEILELPDVADARESLELDHALSVALAGLPPQRVNVIDASSIPPDLGGLPGYRMQVTLPRGTGGEDYVARCYRSRGEVLYTMTAYGDAAAWDREPQLLEDVEATFDSFAILDRELSSEDQLKQMLRRHQPGFSAEGNRFSDSSTGLSFIGPEGWSMRPLACGRVRWAPHDGRKSARESRPPHGVPPHEGHPDPRERRGDPHGENGPRPAEGASEEPWVEVTWLSSENGWNDRVPALMRNWEKSFDSLPEVRRGSVRAIDRPHKRPLQGLDQLRVTELYTMDYAYASPKGAKRRTRMVYIPCGKLMFLVRADAGEDDFARLEASFEQALASFSIR